MVSHKTVRSVVGLYQVIVELLLIGVYGISFWDSMTSGALSNTFVIGGDDPGQLHLIQLHGGAGGTQPPPVPPVTPPIDVDPPTKTPVDGGGGGGGGGARKRQVGGEQTDSVRISISNRNWTWAVIIQAGICGLVTILCLLGQILLICVDKDNPDWHLFLEVYDHYPRRGCIFFFLAIMTVGLSGVMGFVGSVMSGLLAFAYWVMGCIYMDYDPVDDEGGDGYEYHLMKDKKDSGYERH